MINHREDPSAAGRYGDSHSANEHWSSNSTYQRHDQHFNYFNLGNKHRPVDNAVLSYPGSNYDEANEHDYGTDKNYYNSLWTRRPGQDGENEFVPSHFPTRF